MNNLKDIISIDIPTLEIMDIGAMMENEDRYDCLVKQGLANVTGFEPIEENLKKLSEREGPYTYFPVTLGDGTERDFYLTSYPGCSSLLEPNPKVINQFTNISTEPGGNFETVKVSNGQTIKLDSIKLPIPDYVKIDIQGGELLVMEHGKETLFNALVFEIEVEFIPIYKNQPLFGDIHMFMDKYGYTLLKLTNIAGRPFRSSHLDNKISVVKEESQWLWADAIFIRNYTNMTAFYDSELIKISVILHDIYVAYDLVSKFLVEYDERNDTKLNREYVQYLNN